MTPLQPRIFIQQAAKTTKSAEMIISTLVIPIEQFRVYFTESEYTYLKELGLRTVLMRGTDAGDDGRNEKTWAEMELGDVALIAWRGHVEAIGEVVMRKDSPAMAKSRGHNRYHLLYFLRNVERLHVPYARLNSVIGYKENNSFQRFCGLNQDHSDAVLKLLRGIAPALHVLSEDTLARYTLGGEMDSRAEVNRRCEQGLLRKLYFGGQSEGQCAFCGRAFPVDFLVAAHIKKRADCSDEEKRDAQGNVIPACRFGCDELFERGYILGIEGVFKRSQMKTCTQAVDSYIELVEGRPIREWDRRSKYFEWHAESHS